MPTEDHRYAELTRGELYELAQKRDIDGRSDMNKDQLVAALERDDEGPDALRLLTEQHDRIRELLTAFGELSGRPSKRKEDLVQELVTTLVKHAEIEEQVFYPAVAAELSGQEDLRDHSLEEHHAAELLLAELDGMDPGADRYDAKVKVLGQLVVPHLDEEEQELFPKVEAALSAERRREIGAAMVEMWRLAPTRPHPRTPSDPPGNVLMAIPATVIDLTVEAARHVRRRVGRR